MPTPLLVVYLVQTQRNIVFFVLEVNLEVECPVELTELTLAEVSELSRTQLPKDEYDLYIVSPLQKNVAKALANHTK